MKEALKLALDTLKRMDGWLVLRNGSGLTSKEKQIVATIEAALAQPEQEPWTDEQQIAEALRVHGLTLVKNASGYGVLKLGNITAHIIKENT